MFLITGSTGMTGIEVLKYLEASGHNERVKCIVRSTSDLSKHDSINLAIEYIICDLESFDEVDIDLRGVDVILHIASIRFSKSIMHLAKLKNIKRVILVHTALMYSKYFKYAKYFQRIEGELIQENDIPYTILRPTMLYGNEMDKNFHSLFQEMMTQRLIFIQGNSKVYYQPTYVGDLVRAIFDVIDYEKCYYETFILSGKEAVFFGDIVKKIRRLTKRRVFLITVPFVVVKWKVKLEALLNKKNVPTLKEFMRKVEDRRFSHGKAVDFFGYDPIGIEEGLKREYQAVFSHYSQTTNAL